MYGMRISEPLPFVYFESVDPYSLNSENWQDDEFGFISDVDLHYQKNYFNLINIFLSVLLNKVK